MWQKNWTPGIVVVKKEYNAEHYKTLGLNYLMGYYDKYSPFNQLTTVAIETNDRLGLTNNDKYYVMIDRLAVDEDKNYYVIDYKTNANPANQTTLDKDTQLAMYSLWVKDKFLDAKSIKLVWNFLATDEEKVSVRTDEELVEMKNSIENKINEIGNCIEYPATTSKLCDYCEYKSICPEWKRNEIEEVKPKYTRQKLLNAYLK
jgi:CRISPR/Cas system-associated exonuclease Cas4 (RecB family)